jgi:hypothetical protein
MSQAQQIINGLSGCWIAPNGLVFEVTFCRHAIAAQTILDGQYGIQADLNAAESELIRKGWLHVGQNFIGKKSYNEITDDQVTSLFEIYRNCGVSLHATIDQYMRR